MGKHKGLIFALMERLDELMKAGLGTSRYAAKKAHRDAGENVWAFSDGKLHSHGSRNAYQQHALAFAKWARDMYEIRYLEDLDARVEELATAYLNERLAAGKSPSTLQSERSAMRLVFNNRDLGADVPIPPRRQRDIKRSRGEAIRDKDFQPANWAGLIYFLNATGLRRDEARRLLVKDIQPLSNGLVEVEIRPGIGKGGRPRRIPVLPGHEDDVLQLRDSRDLDAPVFARLPSHLDIHAIRRRYAQAYYQFLSGRELPPTGRRLRKSDYDADAVLRVSQALGHNRHDIVLRHYLR